MGKRITRVNELLMRELSLQLHTTYKDESVYITITDVDVSPDLRSGVVYYSVLGDEEKSRAARKFFHRVAAPLRQSVSEMVKIKYTAFLKYVEDDSMARGTRTVSLIDSIVDEEPPSKEQAE